MSSEITTSDGKEKIRVLNYDPAVTRESLLAKLDKDQTKSRVYLNIDERLMLDDLLNGGLWYMPGGAGYEFLRKKGADSE